MLQQHIFATLILIWSYLIMTIKLVQSDDHCLIDHLNLYTAYFNTRMLNNDDHADTCSRLSFKTLQNWQLSNRLYHLLPIEAENRNFVRQVNNVVFSPCPPTPFNHPPKLVAASKNVIQHLLDLNYEDVIQSKHFVDFAAGHVLQTGSIPVSHRYGGHQV